MNWSICMMSTAALATSSSLINGVRATPSGQVASLRTWRIRPLSEECLRPGVLAGDPLDDRNALDLALPDGVPHVVHE